MSGLANLSPLSEAAEKIEGLAGLPNPNVTGIYPGAQQPSEKTSPEKRGIMEEGYDSFLHTLGPQNISLFGAGIRALGAVVQQEDAYGAGYKIEQYGENLDMGETPSTSLREVEDFESLARWAAGGLGQGLGSIGPPIVAGGLGFAAGTAVGGPGVGALTGAASAFAVNDVILTGEAFKQFEESGVDRLTAAEAAAAIGPPMAVLDTLGLMKMLRGPARARKGLLKYIGQRIAQGSSVESATEMAQGVIREFTDASLTGDPKLAERAFNIVEEGLVAAMTGGVVGGGVASFSRKTSEPEPAPEPEPIEDVSEEETPVPEDTLTEQTVEDPLEVQLVDDLATAETELEGVKESLEEVTPEPKKKKEKVAKPTVAPKTEEDLKTVDVAPEESYTEFKDTEPEPKKPNTKKMAGLEAVAPETVKPKTPETEKLHTAKPGINDKIIVHAPTQEMADTIAGGIDEKMSAPTIPAEDKKKTDLAAGAPTSTPEEIKVEALKTEPAPTEKQKEAGNYKKGHIKVAGFDVTIENAKGSKRSGIGKDGEKWEVRMPAHYGYIRRTEGADGEQIDIYVGDDLDSQAVYVFDQYDADTQEFDEHKVMMGFTTLDDAKQAYDAAFDDGRGPERRGKVTAFSNPDYFKEWLNKEDTTKPVAEAKIGEDLTTDPDTEPKPKTELDIKQPDRIPDEDLPDYNDAGLEPTDVPEGFIDSRNKKQRPEVIQAIEKASEAILGYKDAYKHLNKVMDDEVFLDTAAWYGGDEWFGSGVHLFKFFESLADLHVFNKEFGTPGFGGVVDAGEARKIREKMREVAGLGKNEKIEGTNLAAKVLASFGLKGMVGNDIEHDPDNMTIMSFDQPEINKRITKPESKPKTVAKTKPKPKTKATPTRTKPEPKQIGTNIDGNPIFEDERGVRSFTRDGIAITERVGIIPGGGISINPDKRTGDYLTEDERATREAEKPESEPEPEAETEGVHKSKTYGKDNKVFTEDKYNEDLDFIKDFFNKPPDLGQVNSGLGGLDPNMFAAVFRVAGYHVEGGARAFAQFSKAMVDSLGEGIKPYLKMLYGMMRDNPDLDIGNDELSTPAEIDEYIEKEKSDETAERETKESGSRDVLDEREHDEIDAPRDDDGAKPEPAGAIDSPTGTGTVREGTGGRGDETTGVLPESEPRRDKGTSTVHPTGLPGEGATEARPDAVGSVREPPRSVGNVRYFGRGTESGVDPLSFAGSDLRFYGTDTQVDPDPLSEKRSPLFKARDNIEAIKIVKMIRNEKRHATKSEQEKLSLYVGWGPAKGAFPNLQGNYASGFETVGKELKQLLTEKEYFTAQQSIQNAHYTSTTVIYAMWELALKLGVKKGSSILEPGMGIGHFAGFMPEQIRAGTKYHGIEMDAVTADIAKELFPDYNIEQNDFAKTKIEENSYDFAIGNPPFANIAITSDRKYADHKFLLHDYFFAKSLDALKPGGVLMFVTSAGTMNKQNKKAREYLAERADLIGSIRLPGGERGAFSQSSNTQVTTDIIILRKRKRGEKPSGAKWVNTVEKTFSNFLDRSNESVELNVNEYFVENKEMILGMEGPYDTLIPGRYGVVRPPEMFTSALKKTIETFPDNIFNPIKTTPKKKTSDVIDEESPEHKEGSFYLKGSDIYQYSSGEGRISKLSAANSLKMKMLIEIKNSLRDVFAADIVSDDSAGDAARIKLNSAYDEFVKKYGHLNKSVTTYSKPTAVQIEKARASLRLITLENDEQWNEGTFIPSAEFFELSFTDQSKVRAKYRASVISRGDEYSEGSFNPASVPKNVHDNYPNLKAFSNDPEYYRLASIEKVVKQQDDAPDSIEKGKVFYENIFRLKSETKIESIQDAVSSVIAEHGVFDLDKVVELYGKNRDETIAELGDQIFQLTAEPFDTWAERSDYLSGDVKTKLEQAKDATQNYPQFQRNVDELEKVIPEDLVPSEIEVKVGAQWLDNRVHGAFLEHLGIRNSKVTRPGHKRELMLDGGYTTPEALSNWGQYVRPQTLIMAVLNAKPSPKAPQLTDSLGKKYADVESDSAVQAQYKLVKAEWNMWWEEQEIYRQEAAVIYNEKFRRTIPRQFDGSNLNPPGMLKDFSLRNYQKSIITRIIQSTRNTYMSHAVGAGKTASMIISAMELKRLGQIKLPMITVPKSVLRQFSIEWMKLYPDANVKIMQAEDTKADSRKHVIADVTLNEYDAVVVSHETFNRINLPAEFQEKMIMEEIAGLRAMYRDAEARHTRNQIELQIQAMVQKLEKLTDSESKDDVFDFSEIGVDYLIVDEAHNYRKIGIKTTMNVKGVDTGSSQRGMNLYWISKWLRENHGSKTMTLASGTPILNTQGEVYSIQRLLQEPTLLEQGIDSFTSWANLYAEVVSRFEMDAGGNYKYVDRLSKFVNLGDLRNTLDEVFDTVTSQELNKLIVMPTLAGKDGREMMLTPMSDLQKTYQDVLKARIQLMGKKDYKGVPLSEESKRDFILPIMGDGRKASIDMRLIDPDFPNDPESKLNLMIDQIYKTWEETSNQPLHRVNADETGYDEKPFTHGPATQLVFVSLGLSGPFQVQNWIRARLVKMGMPNAEIAYIKDFDTATKRAQLFQEVRAGRVRVVMGHPTTLGTGVNVQDRVAQIHNLDPLWLVGEDEQRVGRALRFGNMNPKISVQDWSMNGGFDSPMWGLMKTKSSFITDFFKSDLNEVEALQGEDYYQILEAASSGDPRYKELATLKRKQNDLKQKKKIYEKTVATTTVEIAYLKHSIKKDKETVEPRQNLAKLIEDIKGDKFKFTFFQEGKAPRVITDRRKANQAISSTASQLEKDVTRETRPNVFVELGNLAGLDLWINVKPPASMLGEARYSYKVVPPGKTADHPNQYRFDVVTSKQQLESIVSTIRNIDKNIEHFSERIKTHSAELTVLEKKQKTLSFDENADIKELNEKTIELERELASEQTETATKPTDVAIYKTHPHFVQIIKDRVERGDFSIGPKPDRKGLSTEIVKQTIEKITSKWDQSAVDILPNIEVVETTADLPESIIKLAGENSDNINAVLWQESIDDAPIVYIVADRMNNNKKIKSVLAHEMIGHVGMEDLLGDDFPVLLAQVWLDRDLPMYKKYRDTVEENYPDADPDTFAMEMIAHMAEKRAKNPIMTRIIAAVRRFLRKIGLDITYSYDTVMDYLSKVERRIYKGKEENTAEDSTEYKSVYEVDDGPSMGDASQRAQLGLREVLYSLNDNIKPMKPPLLELTRPVESFFRLLSVPLGGRDANGNLKLSKPMQEAARKVLREMNPSEDGAFSWLNPFIETARHGWLNRYGTPEGFEAFERVRSTDEFMILQEMVGFIHRLKDIDVDSSQARALNDLLVKGTQLDDDALNDLGSEIRNAIDKLGKQMVEAGILHEETYQKNLGKYLHRSYTKYEFDKKPLMRWAQSRAKTKRASIIGDELRLQGRAHNFGSVNRLMQDVPEDLKENSKWIKKWIIFDRVSETGRVSKRMYYPANWKVEDLGKSWVSRGTWEIRKNPRGQPFLWRQWTEEESEAMGLIEDARYNIIKSYQLMAHDLASAKFFNDVAANPAWYSETMPEGTVLGSVDPRQFKPGNYSKYDWIKVPDISIPKSSVKKWGAISGGYLRAPIWRDINELEKMQQPGWWGWMMRLFKESKTVLSPNVHFNNVMGNVVLSELHDFTWTDIKDGFLEYARKGDLYKQAYSKGVFNSGYVESELSGIPEIEQIIREIEKQHGTSSPDVYKIASFFSKIRMFMRNSYRAEDEVFRMMSYMHDIGRGMNESEAAKNAIDRFLNYDIRAPWPNALRRSVLPFFSYTYSFVPVWLRAMSSKPWKIAKIFTYGYVIQALSREMLGDDEDERKVMAERDKGYTWSGLPKMLRTPFSQDGDPIYIGMQRLLPGGGIMETDNNILGMPEWFAIGGPIQIAGEVLYNRSQFSGQDIVNDMTDTGTDKTFKRMSYLWRAAIPNIGFLPGTWNYENLTRAFGDDVDLFGRQYNPVTAIVRQFGPKLYPFDKDAQLVSRVFEINREIQELKAELSQKARLHSRNRISDSQWARDQKQFQVKIGRLTERVQEFAGTQ